MRTSGCNARTRLGTIALAATSLLLATTPGRAQEPLLLPGDSVRISTGARTAVYTYVRADSSSLYVRDGQTALQLPISRLDRVEHRVPRPPERIGRMVLTGTGAGLATGFMVGVLWAEDPGSGCWGYCPSRGEQIAGVTVAAGLIGLVVGGIAAFVDADRPYWRPIDAGGLPVAVAPAAAAGGVGLAIRWSWSGQRGHRRP